MSGAFFQEGDVVVVTGAAQGLGRAIAHRLALHGAKLALWDIEAEGLKETVAICREQGAEVEPALVDVGSEVQIIKAAATASESLGPVFGLVNNAGIYPIQPFEQVTFAGKYASSRSQPVIYVTERCVMKLTPQGIVLTLGARGVHRVQLQRSAVGEVLGLEDVPHLLR